VFDEAGCAAAHWFIAGASTIKAVAEEQACAKTRPTGQKTSLEMELRRLVGFERRRLQRRRGRVRRGPTGDLKSVKLDCWSPIILRPLTNTGFDSFDK
jgi:hypothetical protein